MKPSYLDELIERASKKAGSDAALARELEVGRSLVSDWKHDRKPCSPEDQALMAGIAGLDADAWGARAMVEKHAGTAKGAKLEAALKKALAATGAAMLSFSAHAQTATDGFHEVGCYLIRCIFSKGKSYQEAAPDSRILLDFCV